MKLLFSLVYTAILLLILLFGSSAFAHFQCIIPSDDMIMAGDSKDLQLDLIFLHPFEGHYMDMAKPVTFAVHIRGKNEDLTSLLTMRKNDGHRAWRAQYPLKRPGDYLFYVEPSPYFEPAEQSFIIHYTKIVVHALGLEEGWDEEIGLKTEIMPLTRPYGIWTGNVFQGMVKVYGKPVPYAEVEVEYFAEGGIKPPADPFVTQVIRADSRGVFTYACPKAGWWGFAALSRDRKKIRHSDGREYPVEIGAVFWIHVYDMP
jgi:cobalt/nickel transport protein